MKRVFATLFLVITTITVFAQSTNDNTLKFLGHPVDGSKSKMANHLRNKGFTYDSYSDCYKGKFNGKQVDVYISTNNDIVDRIYVSFPTTRNVSSIINEYNILLGQFKNNDKYLEIQENPEIPEDENLSYEMNVSNKIYSASFYYRAEQDTLALQQEFLSLFTEEEIEILKTMDLNSLNFNNDKERELFRRLALFVGENERKNLTGSVWFMIHESYGNYNIGLYYDNPNNRPNGEDL